MSKKKRCPGCKKTLPSSAFNKNRANKSGLQNECRECANARGRRKTAENRKLKELKEMQVPAPEKQEKFADLETKKKLPDAKNESRRVIDAKRKFLHALTETMERNFWDCQAIAHKIGYDPKTVSSYLNGPEKCSEQFIRMVSKKIPDLATQWLKYQETVEDKAEPSLSPVETSGLYLLVYNSEIMAPESGPLTIAELNAELEYLIDSEGIDVATNYGDIEIFEVKELDYWIETQTRVKIHKAGEARYK